MKSDAKDARYCHVTGHHEFCAITDGRELELEPLLAVRAGLPIAHAMAVTSTILECVEEFEARTLRHGPQDEMSVWASRWLLTIAEALIVSAQKGSLGPPIRQ